MLLNKQCHDLITNQNSYTNRNCPLFPLSEQLEKNIAVMNQGKLHH